MTFAAFFFEGFLIEGRQLSGLIANQAAVAQVIERIRDGFNRLAQ